MKKIVLLSMLLGAITMGCGGSLKEADTSGSSQSEISVQYEAQSETTDFQREEELSELTFESLSRLQFGFSSGAGGWSEEFTIEKDGYFSGIFHDTDMGDTGLDYENGTVYSSSYSGHFTELTKIDEYTYKMKLADITYRKEAGTEEIKQNRRYIYTESYCLGGNDVFTIYLAGTPLERISEEIQIWLNGYNQSEKELTMTIIADEKNAYGIYSHDRLSALEDAKMTYAAYKESYDSYKELLNEAKSTMEMQECSDTMYELSDECLNYIWNLIRYNIEGNEYQQILMEQREWINHKEYMAEEAAAEFEGGSFATVAYSKVAAKLTIERCAELLTYLE